MEFKYSLNKTLKSRFTDRDEMEDISRHGINCGYSGFLYTHEINEFFNEFENEIEEYFYEMLGDTWLKESGAAECDSMDALRAHLVWALVETWVNQELEDLDNEEDECYVDNLITAGV